MVFSSLIFLWAFLPVVWCVHFLTKSAYRNALLFAASLFFYAWGEPIYVALMAGSVCVNWLIGLGMERFPAKKKPLLMLAVVLNLGVLCYYKYFDFFAELACGLLGRSAVKLGVALPIGISFFTFQILSYVIDLYRGKYRAQKSIIDLGLYISFFPQLIAGPIVRYKDICEQLRSRELTASKTAEGIRRFIYGLAKKVIIANTLAEGVDAIYALESKDITGSLAWIAAVFYMLQIYYDFSGYSDMAIGLGKMFGFEFTENFDLPYLSKSIREFWRRWHISLGSWFREYLYFPLGGNRKDPRRTYANLLTVFFFTGLWHGASMNFILWGMYHGFFQIIERLGFDRFLKKAPLAGHVYAFLVVLFGWVLFRAEDLAQAMCVAERMLMPWKYTSTSFIMQEAIGSRHVAYAVIAVLFSGIIQRLLGNAASRLKGSYAEMLACAILMLISLAMLAGSTYNPFIYFRF